MLVSSASWRSFLFSSDIDVYGCGLLDSALSTIAASMVCACRWRSMADRTVTLVSAAISSDADNAPTATRGASMATIALTVNSRTLGLCEPAALPEVVLELDSDRITVRELIARAVRLQIDELRRRQDEVAVLCALGRHYLTAEEVMKQAASGQVALPSAKRPGTGAWKIDVAHEIARAHEGFERQAFRVVVDGRMLDRLEDVIRLSGQQIATFLRLVPLRGG